MLYIIILLLWIVFARPRRRTFLFRIIIILPFAAMLTVPILFFSDGLPIYTFDLFTGTITITDTGIETLKIVFIKLFLSLLGLAVFTVSDGITDILKGLRKAWMPATLLNIIYITISYIGIIADQARRMMRAQSARSFAVSPAVRIRISGALIGSLFIRSYNRSNFVYQAMLARGYSGDPYDLPEQRLPHAAPNRSRIAAAYIFGFILFLALGAVVSARFINGF